MTSKANSGDIHDANCYPCYRDNFELVGPYGTKTSAFHNIHTYVQDRLNERVQSLKKKKEEGVLEYLRCAMMYGM